METSARTLSDIAAFDLSGSFLSDSVCLASAFAVCRARGGNAAMGAPKDAAPGDWPTSMTGTVVFDIGYDDCAVIPANSVWHTLLHESSHSARSTPNPRIHHIPPVRTCRT